MNIRNTLCSCGSGKKHKNCCGRSQNKKFDCSIMVHQFCQANCCNSVLIKKIFYLKNKEKIINQSKELIPFDDRFLPKTENGKCVYLKNDYKCNIYNDRPDECKL